MFGLDFRGRKKERLPEMTGDSYENESSLSEDDLHDSIVEAVLESAEKIAKDKNIAAGKNFDLPVVDIPIESEEISSIVDLETDLRMHAREYGIMFLTVIKDGTSLRFQRLGRTLSQVPSR